MKKSLVLIVAFAILAVGGYFWFQAQRQETGDKRQTKLPVAEISPGTNEYHSGQFGITFRYPAPWIIAEPEPGLIILKPNKDVTDDLAPISVDVRGVEPYEDAVREIRRDTQDKSEISMTFGPYPAVAISGRLSPDVGEHANTPFTFTMIDQGGRLSSIDYLEFDPALTSGREAYREIVASFRFVR